MEDDQVEEEEEEEEESLSPSDSSDEYTVDREEEDDDGEEGERRVAQYPQFDEDRKSKNVDDLLRGNLVVRRQPLLPRVLSVTEGAAICRKPFKPPCSNGYNDGNEHLARRLWARKRFVPWGSSKPVLVAVANIFNCGGERSSGGKCDFATGIDPLVLWQPEESEDGVGNLMPIVVDPLLVRFLRPHQREGVQFMFECVSGFYSTANINGCILADDMGLGKTLQSITLLYTLLGQGFDGKPMVLIVSYETFRMHSSKFSNSESCDLLICDEAHRLKNDQTITNRTPIICGREPTATEEEKKLGAERSGELSAKVNQISSLDDEKLEVRVKRAITEEAKKSKILAYITALKKLCNHPKLIFDTIKNGSPGISGFEDCMRFFPPGMFSGRSGSWTGGDGAWVELSGKMHVLARLLAHLHLRTDDRINPHIRLDGTTSISKRQKLVNRFNDPSKDEFVFLLSSKAGGCGLNLIGGNRLVLFDPDWNPANDKQAAARVWRDGQKKRVYQRQMSKEGLQKVIQHEQNDSLAAQENCLSTEDLRDLFTFQENVRSEIHEKMNCARCLSSDGELEGIGDNCMPNQEVFDIGGFAAIAGCLDKLKSSEKQVGTPLEEDLGSWGHHFHSTSVPDTILQASAGDEMGSLYQLNQRPSPRVLGIKGNESRLNDKENLDRNPRLSRYQKPQQSLSSNIDAKKVTPSASLIPLQRPAFHSQLLIKINSASFCKQAFITCLDKTIRRTYTSLQRQPLRLWFWARMLKVSNFMQLRN
ncbi:LOW QUALITY PROTEIN: protein CHROMATIN REMODELING 25 [Populus alba x Populus x berolinensis]|uniref:Protein CHROMATIN REMODELING 25 n=1 Tax=Populus alba x Populus x berolinensis TaxID=444605 RepID=A0AAD6W968_9ROSI|nr:LOW QUALITY PROTEIN: protein CHROMATIN REMODELING 25 [Populus alba x Populus x berolinensis]